jgi:HKD family nuclease
MNALLYEPDLIEAYRRMLRQSDRFHMAMALVTATGIGTVRSELEECLSKNGKGQFLVGIDMPSEPDAIQVLLDLYKTYRDQFQLRVFRSTAQRVFHAKLGVFELRSGKCAAIVGSSNLTNGGMGMNYEANVWLDDRDIVGTFLDYFTEHFQGGRARNVSEAWLEQYRAYWAQRKKLIEALRRVREKIRRLRARPTSRKPVPKRVRGHTFAFTGKITDWPRERRLYPLVNRLKGTVVKHAKGIVRVDCLVHGDILGRKKTTRKLCTARQNGVPIIQEEEFFMIVKRERLRRHK